MRTRATGTLNFGMETWDEHPRLEREGETRLTQAQVASAFVGDLAGESRWEALLAYPPSTAYPPSAESSATFVGFMQVTGRLGDRSGSFTLREEGTWAQGALRASWVVVPHSATGELKGLRGEGGYHLAAGGGTSAPYVLTYELTQE